MSVYFDFDAVDGFSVGTVGRPGQRTFLIQARHGHQRVTIKCEKQQAAAIAQYLRNVLSDLPPADERPLDAALELTEPVDVAFVLGPVGLGYERAADRVLVQLDEIVPVDSEGEPDPDALDDRGRVRVLLTRGQVEAFCEQTDRLMAAGRPPCRWCGFPIDPDGHRCPRMN
jgi:uncharacterized repeat protein (TIGR03847 family)